MLYTLLISSIVTIQNVKLNTMATTYRVGIEQSKNSHSIIHTLMYIDGLQASIVKNLMLKVLRLPILLWLLVLAAMYVYWNLYIYSTIEHCTTIYSKNSDHV